MEKWLSKTQINAHPMITYHAKKKLSVMWLKVNYKMFNCKFQKTVGTENRHKH